MCYADYRRLLRLRLPPQPRDLERLPPKPRDLVLERLPPQPRDLVLDRLPPQPRDLVLALDFEEPQFEPLSRRPPIFVLVLDFERFGAQFVEGRERVEPLLPEPFQDPPTPYLGFVVGAKDFILPLPPDTVPVPTLCPVYRLLTLLANLGCFHVAGRFLATGDTVWVLR